MSTPTTVQDFARLELNRRGRDELGRKTHKKTSSRTRRGAAYKRGMFKLSTKELVQLAQSEWTITDSQLEELMTEPKASTSTGSIVLDNTSARNRARVSA